MIGKIVSGGQTGVDRAALDAAIEAGIECGGWCPRGRRAEDGVIPDVYPLRETRGAAYIERTRLNVRDSDGTLVLARGRPRGGTKATVDYARRRGKPCLVVDLDGEAAAGAASAIVRKWLADCRIGVLNVAGPRESTRAGTYDAARAFLRAMLGEDDG